MSLKIRLMIIGGILAVAGAVAVVNLFFGEATLHLVVPAGRTIALSANGQVLAPKSTAGDHVRFSVAQGNYTLAVKDQDSGQERTYTLNLDSGFADYVLPIDERQCFTRLDVTKAMYGSNGVKVPQIVERISAQGPIAKKSSDYLEESEMPKSIKRGRSVMLLAEVDCEALKLEDGALLSEVGF